MLKKTILGLACGAAALTIMGCEDKKAHQAPQTEQRQEPTAQDQTHAALPTDFNADTYLKLNPDVDAHFGHLSGQERQDAAKNHYLTQGVNESRKYK
ncbi:MAG: hypothetical protein H2057_02380 [Alphaproteobacteria bacterium]|nr:hypothetical protein [Alphaproteobacteria bacterium]